MKAEVNLITGYNVSQDERGSRLSKGCSTISEATIDNETMKQILYQKEQKLINSMYY